MRYDSALELQSRVFSRIFHFEEVPMASVGLPGPATFVDPCLMEPAAAAKRLRTRAKRRIVEDIALGITAPDASGTGKAETDSRLAVLVQNRKMLSCHEIDAIKDLARGEAEIVYIGRQRPLWMTARNAPLKMGCSISPSTVNYSGTLGCFCRDSQTGETGILSNNHVLADVNRIAADTPIIQPAAGDGGSAPADVIGRLKRYVPILFGGMPNAVDAAFATTADHDRGEDRQTIFDNASPPQGLATLRPDDKVEAFPGLEVMKTGRTTGHTLGRPRRQRVADRRQNRPTRCPFVLRLAVRRRRQLGNYSWMSYIDRGSAVERQSPVVGSTMNTKHSMGEAAKIQKIFESRIADGIPGIVGIGLSLNKKQDDLALNVQVECEAVAHSLPKHFRGLDVVVDVVGEARAL